MRKNVATSTLAVLLVASGALPAMSADASPTGALLPSAAAPGQDAERSPGPSAPAGLDPALAAVELMNMPPTGVMETCAPGSPSMDGQRAVVQCAFGDDVVVYASWIDPASLAAAYEGIAAAAGVVGGSSCQEGPFEGAYLAADGIEAGRVVCQDSADGLLLGWTDDRNLVLGFLLVAGGGGFAELHDHWLHVRLDATSTGGASPSVVGASPEPVVPGAGVRQWASSATASSEYSTDSWSAQQATGVPDAPHYGGHSVSWSPASDPGEPEWIELTYDITVVPTEIHIWEGNGAGFVVQVEALDEATGEWVTLWQGTDPTPPELLAFTPPLTTTDIATRRIRVTAGPGGDGYPYVDAVELVGTVPTR
jgi:hypothetical protein